LGREVISMGENGKRAEGFVEVKGGKIWYCVEGADKSGIPLIILHGGPGTPHDYLEPLSALSDERPVIFYDQLGCGRSDRPSDKSLWTVEHFVGELNLLKERLRLGRVHILGQSWGTILACEYYFFKPEEVVSMVLSGPAMSIPQFEKDVRKLLAFLPKERQNAIHRAEASGRFDSREYADAMRTFYNRHVCRLDPWPDCLNRTLEGMGTAVYEYMYGPSEFTVTGTLRNYSCVHRLGEIEVPVLLTCGRFDEATPSTIELYRREIVNCEMKIIEDASHEHHLEKPEEYMEAVRSFLKKVESHGPRKYFE